MIYWAEKNVSSEGGLRLMANVMKKKPLFLEHLPYLHWFSYFLWSKYLIFFHCGLVVFLRPVICPSMFYQTDFWAQKETFWPDWFLWKKNGSQTQKKGKICKAFDMLILKVIISHEWKYKINPTLAIYKISYRTSTIILGL